MPVSRPKVKFKGSSNDLVKHLESRLPAEFRVADFTVRNVRFELSPKRTYITMYFEIVDSDVAGKTRLDVKEPRTANFDTIKRQIEYEHRCLVSQKEICEDRIRYRKELDLLTEEEKKERYKSPAPGPSIGHRCLD